MKDVIQEKLKCCNKALGKWLRVRALLATDPDNVDLIQRADKARREYQALLENLTRLMYGHK